LDVKRLEKPAHDTLHTRKAMNTRTKEKLRKDIVERRKNKIDSQKGKIDAESEQQKGK
jgi:hypothetical protein